MNYKFKYKAYYRIKKIKIKNFKFGMTKFKKKISKFQN